MEVENEGPEQWWTLTVCLVGRDRKVKGEKFLSYMFGLKDRKENKWKNILFGWKEKWEDKKCNLYKNKFTLMPLLDKNKIKVIN